MIDFLKKLFKQTTTKPLRDKLHLTPITNKNKWHAIINELNHMPYDDGLFSTNDFSRQAQEQFSSDKAHTTSRNTTNKMNTYNTNISTQYCSCKDWEKRRYKYKKDDPRRLCKHIISQLDLDNLPSNLIPFKKKLAYCKEEKKGFETKIYSVINIPDTDLVVLYKENWIDVYDSNGERYSFVLYDYENEDIKWAMNDRPKNYQKLEDFFQSDDFQLPIPIQHSEIKDIKNYLQEEAKQEYLSIEFTIDYGDTPNSRKYRININDDKRVGIEGKAEVSNKYIRLFELKYYSDHIFLRNNTLVQNQKSIRNNKRLERLKKEEYIRTNYVKTKELIQQHKPSFGLNTFYRLLSIKDMVRKENQQYIAIGDGLGYGMNINGVVHWEKSKFKNLLKILEYNYSLEKKTTSQTAKENKKQMLKQKREELTSLKRKDINGNILVCPSCGSFHIHKKGFRGTKQRYQCQECRHIFMTNNTYKDL